MLGVSKATFMGSKAKYDGLELNEAKRLVADLSLDRDALQWLIEKNGWSSQLSSKR